MGKQTRRFHMSADKKNKKPMKSENQMISMVGALNCNATFSYQLELFVQSWSFWCVFLVLDDSQIIFFSSIYTSCANKKSAIFLRAFNSNELIATIPTIPAFLFLSHACIFFLRNLFHVHQRETIFAQLVVVSPHMKSHKTYPHEQ